MQSNSNVEQITTEALSKLESHNASLEDAQDLSGAMKVMTSLSGVGPATASLLLATAYPQSIPFFSDELYRWMTFDDPGSDKAKTNGWTRKIGYTMKEYLTLYERVAETRTRLEGVSARDMELVAWVLGHESKADSVKVSAQDEESKLNKREADTRPLYPAAGGLPEEANDRDTSANQRSKRRKPN